MPPSLEDLDCHWTIASPIGNTIKIKIDHVNLPANIQNSTHNCTDNFIEVPFLHICCQMALNILCFVQIRDGYSSLAHLIRKICGNENSFYTTSGRYGFIRLVIRGVVRETPFVMQVTTIPCKYFLKM